MEQKNIPNPIVIHPHLIQKFMKQDKQFANLLALYTFYIYHAQLQKTNQPLATDEFAKNGLNWALDRVKKTKRILKELKVIEVIQHKKYYYVHLFFIYTKNKITDFLNKNSSTTATIKVKEKIEVKENITVKEKIEEKEVKKEIATKKEKTPFEKELIKHSISPKKIVNIRESILSIKGIEKYRFNQLVFAKWILYCDKKSIRYSKNNLKHWLDRLDKRVTIEQKDAVKTSINRGWKDLYLKDKKESKYSKFLGKSLFLDGKLFEKLQDVDFMDNKFIYIFKNGTVKIKMDIATMFKRYEYHNNSTMALEVKNRIMSVIKRF